MTKARLAGAIVTAVVTAVTLTACSTNPMDMGSGTSPSSPPNSAAAPSRFNDQDIMFARMMIPHHEQAIAMADQILNKAGIDPAVTALADRIKAAQAPEIELMTAWLWTWNAPVSGMPGMDHGSDATMSDSDMAALSSATGAEAERLFLEGMIVHHQGAIDMANLELSEGVNADAKTLAQSIVDSQSAEITEIQGLLARR